MYILYQPRWYKGISKNNCFNLGKNNSTINKLNLFFLFNNNPFIASIINTNTNLQILIYFNLVTTETKCKMPLIIARLLAD